LILRMASVINRVQMYRRIITIVYCLCFLFACAPSERALRALAKGDYCKFCKISHESLGSDMASYNNFGVCLENGWCNWPLDKQAAIEWYEMAARWGVPKGSENLVRLGVIPPSPDLKIAKDQADRQGLGTALAVVAVAGLAVAAAKYAPPSSSANTLLPANEDLQGCCSWHQGISMDPFNNPSCHFSGMVLCNDYQPSPTCKCN
jgi:hypothetical protein